MYYLLSLLQSIINTVSLIEGVPIHKRKYTAIIEGISKAILVALSYLPYLAMRDMAIGKVVMDLPAMRNSFVSFFLLAKKP